MGVITSGHGGTKSIKRHDKVWKSLGNHKLDAFKLGSECELFLPGNKEEECVFAGFAELLKENLVDALDVLTPGHGQNSSMNSMAFLVFTDKSNLLEKELSVDCFNSIAKGNNMYLPPLRFDILTLFPKMLSGDSVMFLFIGGDFEADKAVITLLTKL